MPHRRLAAPPAAAVVAAVALLCSACQLRVAVDVDVDRHGGGTLAVALAADEELQARAAEAGADPLEELAAAAALLRGDGWRTSDEIDEGVRTVTLSSPFDDPADFDALAGELAEALAADEAALLEPLRLRLEPDAIRLDGGAALQPTAAVADYGYRPRQVVRLLRRTAALRYDVTVTLPGEVTATNADRRDGSTLTWVVEPGESVTIEAAGSRPGPPLLG
jgi:hypothetical protein